ncbi:hypothetical protein BT96DRAFT_1001490 [Gymnopus androsaceus JB14]|uniref:Uncharacterized protein n=1 Tax=Gymnopus androsaceus JB14 TaxID=1447944 RepID=A0A6A4H0N8_9AGAR|nr:hypothetical protein BT96DRAFT_1001490 [Gymnopus androsaceus JB14]
MPNPPGINGYGTMAKDKPANDVLKASLIKYQDERQTQNQKLQSLAKDHGYVIGTTKLNQEENWLGISSKHYFKPSAEQVRQAVSDEVEKGLA